MVDSGPEAIKARKKIAFFLNEMTDRYQATVLPGVMDAALERDVNLITFIGKSLNSPYSFEKQHCIVYNLVSPEHFNGLLINASVSSYSNEDQHKAFCQQFNSMPLVNMAVELEGYPNVLVDNKTGMYQLVTHMIQAHNHRRIAFIRGPSTSTEAEIRFQAYCEALEQNQIPYDPALVKEGNFVWESGVSAIKSLLDYDKTEFTAIIAANDDMLLGAIRELTQRGLSIPDDIAVGGFDNIEETRNHNLRISTVYQPVYEQAKKSAEVLIDLIDEKDVPISISLPTRLIIRESCGCKPLTRSNIQDTPDWSNHKPISLNEVHIDQEKLFRKTIVYIQQNLEPLDDYEETLLELISALVTDLHQSQLRELFIGRVSKLVKRKNISEFHLEFWKNTLLKILELLQNELKESAALYNLSKMINKAVFLIVEATSQYHKRQYTANWQNFWTLRRIIESVNLSYDYDTIYSSIHKFLKDLEVVSCFMSLYLEKQTDNIIPPQSAQLFLVHCPDMPDLVKYEKTVYPCREILPEKILQHFGRYSMAVLPLVVYEEHYGYLVFPMYTDSNNVVFEILSESVSAALKGSILLSTIKQQSDELEKKVQERTSELETKQTELLRQYEIMTDELILAKKIQDKFIPKFSPRPNIAFFYQPMEQIGGDFFDFIQFPNGSIGLFVSDVSGHGVPAAFVTSMIKSYILQNIAFAGNPSDFLMHLNEFLLNLTAGNFVTAFYGIYNPETNEFVFASAGHNAPYVIGPTISVLMNQYHNIPLAIMNNHELTNLGFQYQNNRVTLVKGTKLFLYTDGLMETVNVISKINTPDSHIHDFENQEFLKIIQKYQDSKASELIQNIQSSLVEFRGSDHFDDDICIICMDI